MPGTLHGLNVSPPSCTSRFHLDAWYVEFELVISQGALVGGGSSQRSQIGFGKRCRSLPPSHHASGAALYLPPSPPTHTTTRGITTRPTRATAQAVACLASLASAHSNITKLLGLFCNTNLVFYVAYTS